MDLEGKKPLNFGGIQKKMNSWSLIRYLQLVLALFCLGYFYAQPMEWITLAMGLALAAQAIFNVQLGCASGACRR